MFTHVTNISEAFLVDSVGKFSLLKSFIYEVPSSTPLPLMTINYLKVQRVKLTFLPEVVFLLELEEQSDSQSYG